MWVLTLVLFHMVLRYGGYFMVMTGGCLLLSNIIYASIRNPFDLVIPFEDGKLEFSWGWCFWLCMFNGEHSRNVLDTFLNQLINQTIIVPISPAKARLSGANFWYSKWKCK